MSIIIRPAQAKDAAQIVEMVNRFAAQNIMLPRSEENVYQTIDDWLVAIERPETIDTKHNASYYRNSAMALDHVVTGRVEEHTASATDREQLIDHQEIDGRVVGCGALVSLNDKLVEVRSLAVDESQHGNGLGSTLVLKLVELARDRGYGQLCALTLRPNFFIRLGFEQVDRWTISPKVWQACIYCPKFHRCDEVAVLMNLAAVSAEEEEARNRQPGWNRLLKWGEWQPLRLAYRYEYQESYKE